MMLMTVNTAERDWIRAFQVKNMLLKEEHVPIKNKTYFPIAIIGSGAGSLFGTALVSALALDPRVEILTTIGGCVLTSLGFKYWDAHQTFFQKEKNKILDRYKPYQIIKGEDLSYLLQHSSDRFQNDILKTINAPQILNTMLYEANESLYILLEKIYRQLPKTTTTLEKRFELEEETLNALHEDVTNLLPYTTTLEKCQIVFGKALESILQKFFSCDIKPANKMAVHNFAIDNKILLEGTLCHY